MKFETERKPMRISKAPSAGASGAPRNLEDLAFASVRELGELVRRKKVSSLALTEMYLGRLKKYDPQLHFVRLLRLRQCALLGQRDYEVQLRIVLFQTAGIHLSQR